LRNKTQRRRQARVCLRVELLMQTLFAFLKRKKSKANPRLLHKVTALAKSAGAENFARKFWCLGRFNLQSM
jgi:hypothetical protein